MIICLGGAGCNCAKEIVKRSSLSDVNVYAVDSVTSHIDLETINKINFISIISDEKNGSGRNRERAQAMYSYHEEGGSFGQMYKDAVDAKAPVVVITSAAGGTGSGSVVPLCEALISRGVQVIPIIICPNMADPIAYHLNTNDLMIELREVGIETYSIFRNSRGDADYTPVNNEVVDLIEIIFGKKYGTTNLDSIDDSDLDVVLNTPGRFIAVSASANDVNTLKKELTRKVLSGSQPAWTEEESENHTFMTAYSLTSMFAESDFKTVFSEINSRIKNVYDEYRNICVEDNNGSANATLIVAGLPRAEVKIIDTDFKEANSIAEGLNKSKRPKFMNRKKAVVTEETAEHSVEGSAIKKFNWV
jgi:hypothetical protein